MREGGGLVEEDFVEKMGFDLLIIFDVYADIVDSQHGAHRCQLGRHSLHRGRRNILRSHHQLDRVSRRILSIRLPRRQSLFCLLVVL